MAIGFGDLVPYSQLPGAVAGQGAENIADQYDAGMMKAAKSHEALSAASMQDLNAGLALAKAPSALALSNLKDAQSINYIPQKPTVSDYDAAQKELAPGKKSEELSHLDQKRIISRAEELALARQPKFDISHPEDYYSQIQPASNSDVAIERAKATAEGRLSGIQMRLDDGDMKQQKLLDWRDKDRVITEAGKNSRVGKTPGVGGVSLPTSKTSISISDKFDKSQEGQMVNMPMFANDPKYRGKIDSALKSALQYMYNLKDVPSAKIFYEKHQADFERMKVPPPPAIQKGAALDFNSLINRDGMTPEQMGVADFVDKENSVQAGSQAGAPLAVNNNSPVEMPEEGDQSAKLREQFSNDVGSAVAPVAKAVGSAAKAVGNVVLGDGNPKPLAGVARKFSPDGREVQKYSDGKWYPVGAQPQAQRKIVTVGGEARAVGDQFAFDGGIWEVTEGDGKRGGAKLISKGAK